MAKIKFNTEDLRDIASGLEDIEGAMQGMFAAKQARMGLEFQPGIGSVIKVEAVYDGSSWETTLEMAEDEPEPPVELADALGTTLRRGMVDDESSAVFPVRSVTSLAIADVQERVEELIEYLDEQVTPTDASFTGSLHKLQEAAGPLASAVQAAIQAETGVWPGKQSGSQRKKSRAGQIAEHNALNGDALIAHLGDKHTGMLDIARRSLPKSTTLDKEEELIQSLREQHAALHARTGPHA